MARKVIEQFVDDLTGEPIEEGTGRTTTLSLDGKSYEIDLSEANLEKLHAVLEPYVAAARKAGGSTSARLLPRRSASRSGLKWSAGYAKVREWAQANSVAVSKQGGVADSVMQAYEDAHK